MKRLTERTDIGDFLLDEIAFINPDDAEGLYNLRDIANHGSDELLYEIANRLAEYEDMEEQGLLLRLPCKVGDTVYQVIPDYTAPDNSLFIEEDVFHLGLLTDSGELPANCYFTLEEAEKALEDA